MKCDFGSIKKNSNLKFSSGYTLIEILVGLTIIGLIFSFGFVNFREFSRRQEVISIARSLKGDLRLAQEQALAGKKPEGAECGGTNTLSGYHFEVTSATNYVIEAECSNQTRETKNVTIPSDLSLSVPSTNPIIFKVLGQGTNILAGTEVSITITQTGTNNSTAIIVTSGGEIK
jgi:prepilin-type N-terminal cleavage/methylation domain-containing protein